MGGERVIRPRNCVICGEQLPFIRNKNKRYCSKKCNHAARKQRRVDAGLEVKKEQKPMYCADCKIHIEDYSNDYQTVNSQARCLECMEKRIQRDKTLNSIHSATWCLKTGLQPRTLCAFHGLRECLGMSQKELLSRVGREVTREEIKNLLDEYRRHNRELFSWKSSEDTNTEGGNGNCFSVFSDGHQDIEGNKKYPNLPTLKRRDR